VQEQIARNALAIDSAVPGYKIRSMALPQGLWPKNRALASKGSWTNPKTGKTVSYSWPVVFEVAGGPMRSPYDPAFNPGMTPRIQVIGNAIEAMIAKLEGSGNAYISDGNPQSSRDQLRVQLPQAPRRNRRVVYISAGQSGEGGPLRGYARLVGAPNCAPSLCSVAGLLLALALESRYEDPLALLPTEIVTAAALRAARGCSHRGRRTESRIASETFELRGVALGGHGPTASARQRAEVRSD